MNNQIRRIYQYSDANMLSGAELISTFYNEYYTRFSTFDPVLFIEEYGSLFQDNIKKGFSAERDSLVTDQTSKEGSDVTQAIDLFIVQYDDLTYYVNKCFSDEPDIYKQFHHRSISLLKQKPAELILWGEEVNLAVLAYQERLTISGYTNESFMALTNANDELHKHYLEQQEALKRRPEKTADRVTFYNSIWNTVLEIHQAAKRVFRSEPETMALFELPKISQKREKEIPETIEQNGEDDIESAGGEPNLE